MNTNDVVDVFIESSNSFTTCFRRFSLRYNEEVAYEMGFGQAMYVFEAERGQHETACYNFNNNKITQKNHITIFLIII